MNKKFYIIITIILIVFNTFLITKSIKIKKDYIEWNTNLQHDYNKFKEQFFYNLSMITKYGNRIPTNEIELSQKSNKLIYLYSSNECPSCVINDIESIEKFANDSFVNYVSIIPINNSDKEKKIFLNSICPQLSRYPIYCWDTPKISRCFCLTDSSGKVLSTYFSRTGYEGNRDFYLDFIFNQYLSLQH